MARPDKCSQAITLLKTTRAAINKSPIGSHHAGLPSFVYVQNGSALMGLDMLKPCISMINEILSCGLTCSNIFRFAAIHMGNHSQGGPF